TPGARPPRPHPASSPSAATVAAPVPGDPLPEERVAPDARRVPPPVPVGLHVPQLLQAAQVHDLVHHPSRHLLLGEAASHELRHRLQTPRRVAQHLLVPQEQHLAAAAAGGPAARVPVLEHVPALRAVEAPALAEQLGRLLQRVGVGVHSDTRGRFPGEEPRGDQRVLGVSADVHDPHAVVSDDAVGEERVGEVRGEHARGWERLELGHVPVADLEERDAVLRVATAERVVDGRRRLRGASDGGEGEGLEPGGAGLGVAGEEHVCAPGREPGVQRREAAPQGRLRQAEAAVAPQRERRAPRLERERRHQLRHAGVRRRAVVWSVSVLAMARGSH
uniref:Uncharacterized protein n=1 Tax=Triticum urartu TaxID=4572 RepID=A0A8R7UIJ7_TRIUA